MFLNRFGLWSWIFLLSCVFILSGCVMMMGLGEISLIILIGKFDCWLFFYCVVIDLICWLKVDMVEIIKQVKCFNVKWIVLCGVDWDIVKNVF